jgi:hypothetical protein
VIGFVLRGAFLFGRIGAAIAVKNFPCWFFFFQFIDQPLRDDSFVDIFPLSSSQENPRLDIRDDIDQGVLVITSAANHGKRMRMDLDV